MGGHASAPISQDPESAELCPPERDEPTRKPFTAESLHPRDACPGMVECHSVLRRKESVTPATARTQHGNSTPSDVGH